MQNRHLKKILLIVTMLIIVTGMFLTGSCVNTNPSVTNTPTVSKTVVNTPTVTPSSAVTPSATTPLIATSSAKQEITVVSDRAFNTGMHPGGFGGTSRGSPCPLIYEGLLTMGLDGVKGPSLATSWEVSDNGSVWTFHLQKGVKFHDGSDFTSADVKFTADWNIKYGNKMWWAGYVRTDCPDAYTAIIVFNKPRFTFESEAALTEDFIMSKNTTVDEKGVVTQAIGTGPFKLVSINPSEELVLERFSDYWGAKAKLEKVTFKVIADPETQALALQSGQVDAIQCYMKVNIVPRLQTDNNLKVYSTRSINGGAFMMNPARSPFDDISIRKAINYAIDRDTIVNTLLAGSATKSEYMLSPAFGQYVNKDVKNYSYNPEKAKKMIADAGWKDQNGDGYLEKDGKPFAITITLDVNTSDNPRIAEYLQNEFAKLGMKVNINPIEYAMVEKARTTGDYDALLIYTPVVPSDEPAIHYREVYSSFSGGYHLLNNQEVDDLVKQLDNTKDLKERIKIHYKLQEVLMDQSAVAYLFDYNMIIVANKSVQDIQTPVHSRWHWGSLVKAYIK